MNDAGIWYSYTSTKYPYVEEETCFYENKEFVWTKLLEDNFDILYREALTFIENNQLPPYFNKSMTSRANSWRTNGILFWGDFSRKNYKAFRQSWKIVKQIPGICAFSVSTLDGDSEIMPHSGDTNAIIRVHFPLVIPEGLPNCSLTVGGESRAWQKGKPILFNDAQVHSAKNLSGKKRVILILDVIRPEYRDLKYTICAKVLNGINWQRLTQEYPKIRQYPLYLLKIFWSFVRFYIRIKLRLNKLLVWP